MLILCWSSCQRPFKHNGFIYQGGCGNFFFFTQFVPSMLGDWKCIHLSLFWQLKLLDDHTQFRHSKLFGHSFNHHSFNDRNNLITISVLIIWLLKPIEFAMVESHPINDGSFVPLIWQSNLGCIFDSWKNGQLFQKKPIHFACVK
jgi:hypothetical protein